MSEEVLIFLHIPKTAGTTFSGILDRNFSRESIIDIHPTFGITLDEFRTLPQEVAATMRCVRGHFEFGIHEHIRRPAAYVTFLRNPVEQVRSRYNHALSTRFHPLHYMARRGLAEFVRRSPDNFQTRTLVGLPTEGRKEHPPLTEEHLRRVQRRIQTRFRTVGISERFDESLILMKRDLGLQTIRYVRRNVRRKAGQDDELSADIREVLEEHTRLDRALHAWALERLEERVASLGPAFQDELSRFRRSNGRYSRLMWPLDRVDERCDKLMRLVKSKLRSASRPVRR